MMGTTGKKRNRICRTLTLFMIIGGIMLMLYPPFTDLVSKIEQKKLRFLLDETGMRQGLPSEPAENQASLTVPAGEDQDLNGVSDCTVSLPPLLEFQGAVLEIQALELSCVVQKGTTPEVLKKSPGWYVESALPGLGNTAVAAHRTMYGGWFRHLDRLEQGSEILLKHGGYEYRYIVEKVFTVVSNDWSVIEPCGYPVLTLTTCVSGDSSQRMVVRAVLVSCEKDNNQSPL